MEISIYQWLIFSGALVLAMSLPGPGVFATVGHSIRLGFAKTLPFVFGAALGDLTFLWIALLGVAQLIDKYAFAFRASTLIAGIYFLWLGWQMFSSLFTNQASDDDRQTNERNHKGGDGPLVLFTGGYVLTISNPKVVLFYVGLLPLFLDVQAFSTGDYVFVSLLTPLALCVVLSTYAWLADASRSALAEGPYFRVLQVVAGGMFVAVSILLIWRAVLGV